MERFAQVGHHGRSRCDNERLGNCISGWREPAPRDWPTRRGCELGLAEGINQPMKRTIILLAVAVMAAAFAAPVLAQTKECNDEFKSSTYQKWYDNRVKDQETAAQAAKDYLATCKEEDQYSTALKKFVKAWDDIHAAAE